MPAVGELDRDLFARLYGGDGAASWLPVMVVLTVVGSGWGLLGLVPALVARRTRRAGLALVTTVLAAAVIVFALKRLFGRVRPYAQLHVPALWEAPTDYSFPSGHATGSFCVASFLFALLWLRRRPGERARPVAVGTLALGIAAAIAVSRVYLGVHFPGDVLAGALLGLSLGTAGALLYARSRTTAAR